MMQMPTTYVPPHDVPLYWVNETSGVLKEAVLAYFDGRESLTQLRLVIAYVRYVLEAPCWNAEPMEALERLRLAAQRVTTRVGLEAVLWDALELGIDPL
jgi:hypothetical protein